MFHDESEPEDVALDDSASPGLIGAECVISEDSSESLYWHRPNRSPTVVSTRRLSCDDW